MSLWCFFILMVFTSNYKAFKLQFLYLKRAFSCRYFYIKSYCFATAKPFLRYTVHYWSRGRSLLSRPTLRMCWRILDLSRHITFFVLFLNTIFVQFNPCPVWYVIFLIPLPLIVYLFLVQEKKRICLGAGLQFSIPGLQLVFITYSRRTNTFLSHCTKCMFMLAWYSMKLFW